MKPTRKGMVEQNNPWGQANTPGHTRSESLVKHPVIKPARTDSTSDNGKSAYIRKSAGLSTTQVPKNRTPDTSPQMYNNTNKK
jgi:hypothetical protein